MSDRKRAFTSEFPAEAVRLAQADGHIRRAMAAALKRLRRENEVLRQEPVLLKRVTAIPRR